MSTGQHGQPGVPARAEMAPPAALDGLTPEAMSFMAVLDNYAAAVEGMQVNDAALAAGQPVTGERMQMTMIGGDRQQAQGPGLIERAKAKVGGYVDGLKNSVNFELPSAQAAAAAALIAVVAVGAAAKVGLIGGTDPAKASTDAPRIQGEDHGQDWGGTVDKAVMKLDAQGQDQVRAELKGIFANQDEFNDLSVSHVANMQSRLKDFNQANISEADMMEGVALSVLNDQGYRQSVANALQGIDPSEPRSDSAQDQIDLIASAMTNDNTNYGMIELNGLYNNHGQYNDVDVFGDPTVFFGVKAMVMSAPGYDPVIVKAGGGTDGTNSVCLNIETFIRHQQPPAPGTPPSIPPTPGTPSTPNTPHIPPSTPNTPHTPYIPPSTPQIPAKHDPNTTPAGVPGENGGTPDVAGKGPAGQQSDPSGFVPGETHPATPAPEPTPEPLPTQPAPTGPAETGQPTTAPAQPGTGTGTPAPTVDPNPQG